MRCDIRSMIDTAAVWLLQTWTLMLYAPMLAGEGESPPHAPNVMYLPLVAVPVVELKNARGSPHHALLLYPFEQ
jgi:hypothetical protein